LQSAALLHEAGAKVELFVRGAKIHFSSEMPARRGFLAKLRRPDSGLGLGLKNWVMERFPGLVWYLPARWRIGFVKNHLGPSVAWWLAARVTDQFPIHYHASLRAAGIVDGKLRVAFTDANTGAVENFFCDHLVAGTGFEVDIDRLAFLAPKLRSEIARMAGSARLDRSFQSSVPGLYFVGTVSAMSFGPLFRFVVGARYTAKTLSAAIARRVGSGAAVSARGAPINAAAGFAKLQGQRHDAV
jgi:hypothetical protein